MTATVFIAMSLSSLLSNPPSGVHSLLLPAFYYHTTVRTFVPMLWGFLSSQAVGVCVCVCGCVVVCVGGWV